VWLLQETQTVQSQFTTRTCKASHASTRLSTQRPCFDKVRGDHGMAVNWTAGGGIMTQGDSSHCYHIGLDWRRSCGGGQILEPAVEAMSMRLGMQKRQAACSRVLADRLHAGARQALDTQKRPWASSVSITLGRDCFCQVAGRRRHRQQGRYRPILDRSCGVCMAAMPAPSGKLLTLEN
jgi:hypothetical protein